MSPFLSKLANYSNKAVFAQTPNLAFLVNYTSPITNETEQIEKVTPSGLDAAAAFAGVIKQLYPTLLNSTTSGPGTFRIWAASGICVVANLEINVTDTADSEQGRRYGELIHTRTGQQRLTRDRQ